MIKNNGILNQIRSANYENAPSGLGALTLDDIKAIWEDLKTCIPKSDWRYVTYEGCPHAPYRDEGREVFLRNNILINKIRG